MWCWSSFLDLRMYCPSWRCNRRIKEWNRANGCGIDIRYSILSKRYVEGTWYSGGAQGANE